MTRPRDWVTSSAKDVNWYVVREKDGTLEPYPTFYPENRRKYFEEDIDGTVLAGPFASVGDADEYIAKHGKGSYSGDTPHEDEREEAQEEIAEAAAEAAQEEVQEATEYVAELEEAIGEAEDAIPESTSPEVKLTLLQHLENLRDAAEGALAVARESQDVAEVAAEVGEGHEYG